MPHRPFAALLAAGLAGLALAADPPKQDWSAYAPAAEFIGEVTKAKGDSFTLVVTTRVPTGNKNSPFRLKTEEYELTFAEAGLVRWLKLPPKLNAAGKKVEYTSKELAELKKPAGAPGFAADRSALQDGTIVKVHLVRLKSVKLESAVIQDFKVKYAVILSGGNPTPPEKKDERKKDNKKELKKDDKKEK
jgi:hypothetical protein